MPCLSSTKEKREKVSRTTREAKRFAARATKFILQNPICGVMTLKSSPASARTVAKTTALAKHQTSFVIVGLAWGSLQKNCSGGIRTTLDLATFGGALDAQGDQGHVHDLASEFPGDVVRDQKNVTAATRKDIAFWASHSQ